MSGLNDLDAIIQARENIARLDEKVSSMGRELGEVKKAFADQSGKIDDILRALHEARGGWHALMWFGGASATVGAGAAWLLDKIWLR